MVVAFIGFIDATYLTVKHYQGIIPPCAEGFQCETVLTSAYATVAGVPVALGGALYYLAILIIAIIYAEYRFHDAKKDIHHSPRQEGAALLLAAGVSVGLLVSLWFLYVQLFLIHSLCLYCLASGVTSTLIWLVVWFPIIGGMLRRAPRV
jgi:uncharacterized membrane protein